MTARAIRREPATAEILLRDAETLSRTANLLAEGGRFDAAAAATTAAQIARRLAKALTARPARPSTKSLTR